MRQSEGAVYEYAQAYKVTLNVITGESSAQSQDLTQEGETRNGARNKTEGENSPWYYAGITYEQQNCRFLPMRI